MTPTGLAGLVRRQARLWRVLLGIAWRADPVRATAVVVLAPVAGLAASLYGLCGKLLVDAAISRDQLGAIRAAVLLAVSLVGTQLLSQATARLRLSLQQRIGYVLDRDMLDICTRRRSYAELENPEVQDRLELLRRNRPTVLSAVGMLMENLRIYSQLISVTLLLASVNSWLLALPFCALPAVLAANRGQLAQQRNDAAAAPFGRRRRWLLDLATTAGPGKELRIFGLQDEVISRHRLLHETISTFEQSAEWRVALYNLVGWLVFSAGFLGAIGLTLHQAGQGKASPGDVVLLLTVAAQLDSTVSLAARAFGWLRQAAWASSHYLWLRDEPSGLGRPEVPRQLLGSIPAGDLVLDSVSFSYPGTGQPVLTDVSLRIPAGGTVALVGFNGAGKSTLMKLLCRLYEPTSGRIQLGGQDIAEFDADQWRAELAVGFQDFCRFELLAREAIGVGDLPRIDDEPAVAAAARRSGADQVLASLPEAGNTPLGRTFEHGAELSGGQWQRIAVARAVMRSRPRLLLLDEPAAQLDPLAELALFDSYLGMPNRGQTITIVVSHRFSTVRSADLIVVLDAGQVIETGNHSQLMAADGRYAELFRLHAAGYQLTDDALS